MSNLFLSPIPPLVIPSPVLPSCLLASLIITVFTLQQRSLRTDRQTDRAEKPNLMLNLFSCFRLFVWICYDQNYQVGVWLTFCEIVLQVLCHVHIVLCYFLLFLLIISLCNSLFCQCAFSRIYRNVHKIKKFNLDAARQFLSRQGCGSLFIRIHHSNKFRSGS
jgi:hypothetical protein